MDGWKTLYNRQKITIHCNFVLPKRRKHYINGQEKMRYLVMHGWMVGWLVGWVDDTGYQVAHQQQCNVL